MKGLLGKRRIMFNEGGTKLLTDIKRSGRPFLTTEELEKKFTVRFLIDVSLRTVFTVSFSKRKL